MTGSSYYGTTMSKARHVALAGLNLLGGIFSKIGFKHIFDNLPVCLAHPMNKISGSDIFATLVAIQCIGCSTYEARVEFDNDPDFYRNALGITNLPSIERLRQRLDQAGIGFFADEEMLPAINEVLFNFLTMPGVVISPLANGYMPVDLDVTPYDESKSHKEGVSRTYKNFDGFSPMHVYLGREGYFIATDFREGKQHCQKGTPELLVRVIELVNKLTTPNTKVLFRMDSGNDAAINMGILMQKGKYFIIKRNLRQEAPMAWYEKAKNNAPIRKEVSSRTTCYIGSDWKEISYKNFDGQTDTKTVRIVYEVFEHHTVKSTGQYLLFPEVEVNTYWDNTGLLDEDVIKCYHQHGTMEQFHSEIKTDMDLEKLPSRKFGSNRIFNQLSMLSYNILRYLGYLLRNMKEVPLKHKAERCRIGTVIKNIIRMSATVIETKRGKPMLDLGSSNIWAPCMMRLTAMI